MSLCNKCAHTCTADDPCPCCRNPQTFMTGGSWDANRLIVNLPYDSDGAILNCSHRWDVISRAESTVGSEQTERCHECGAMRTITTGVQL